CGYVASINTDPYPSATTEALKLRELLDVAVTRFANFPLFTRRYTDDLVGFAFDLFIGKPVLAVEHHGFFRSGYAVFQNFAAELHAMDERIEWTTPGTICSSACLMKTRQNGEIQVRFSTNQFRITNGTRDMRTYVLLRQWTTRSATPLVNVDGRKWICDQQEGQFAI